GPAGSGAARVDGAVPVEVPADGGDPARAGGAAAVEADLAPDPAFLVGSRVRHHLARTARRRAHGVRLVLGALPSRSAQAVVHLARPGRVARIEEDRDAEVRVDGQVAEARAREAVLADEVVGVVPRLALRRLLPALLPDRGEGGLGPAVREAADVRRVA